MYSNKLTLFVCLSKRDKEMGHTDKECITPTKQAPTVLGISIIYFVIRKQHKKNKYRNETIEEVTEDKMKR